MQLFLIIASTLAAFNIEKAMDGNGEPIIPDGDYEERFLRWVKLLDLDALKLITR